MRRIVILGAGYAGVRAAQEVLGRIGDCELTLVDRSLNHQIVTEMYRVAAGDEAERRVLVPLRRLLPASPNLTLLQADIQALDWHARNVRTSRGIVPYDLALLALGGVPEYYGVEGAKEHALTLQYLDSAERVRRRLRTLARQGAGAHVVIIGGGLTGVELASEIASRYPYRFRMTLVQAADAILPEEDERLAHYAAQELEKFHITIRRGEPVQRVEPRSVRLKSGAQIPSDLSIWTGGVRANALPGDARLPCDGRGRVQVDQHLEVSGHPGIFAAGDIAAVASPRGGTLPPTAQLAVQAGRCAGRNLARLLHDDDLTAFHPKILGTVASLGRRHGIAHLGRFRLTGRPARALHELVLLRYLYGLGGIGLLREEGYLSWTHPPESPLEDAPPATA